MLVTVLWVGLLFNSRRSFLKLQKLAQTRASESEFNYYSSYYKRGMYCDVYVLSVEYDLRFYPNIYIIITKFDSGRLIVDLISGPGPENTVALEGEDAWQYLATMSLDLPR